MTKKKETLEERRKRELRNKIADSLRWPDRVRACLIKRLYNLSWTDYMTMFTTQQGECVICKQPMSAFKTPDMKYEVAHVDHCHKTGKVRGLLCNLCNSGLGKFKDDPVLCRLAATYLERIILE